MVPKKSQNAVAGSLRGVVTVLYVSLALLWLAIPQSVSNFTRESLPVVLQGVAVPAAEAFEAAARKTGLPALYEAARGFFLVVTKK